MKNVLSQLDSLDIPDRMLLVNGHYIDLKRVQIVGPIHPDRYSANLVSGKETPAIPQEVMPIDEFMAKLKAWQNFEILMALKGVQLPEEAPLVPEGPKEGESMRVTGGRDFYKHRVLGEPYESVQDVQRVELPDSFQPEPPLDGFVPGKFESS